MRYVYRVYFYTFECVCVVILIILNGVPPVLAGFDTVLKHVMFVRNLENN